ncbi:MAG: N-6 DNA methylase [Verrucomicrobiota bacterium]|jgi:hypothetical protein
MSAPQTILALVARFGEQLDAYKSGHYNETQLRREFLDPFFTALGWDVDNAHGYAEAYKDVIHEESIRIGGATKAPDYGFRIGGTRKFFLEAKKPSVDIKDEPGAAYQLRRYAWSAKLPLSILSDFEEFAVYDGRVKPHQNDPAATARIFHCTCREFAEKWDWIASIFSRDAVLKGSFDRFAESSKGKRGTSEVDASFLAEIENWRAELARNLALRNPKLTQRELNFAVQRIIDRIIFLRICEDRGIEDYGRLQALVNGDRIYPRLAQLFEAADARYNSGLFHFKPEKDRHEPPDELTLALDLDDKLLRDILRGLYYPDSPYEFSVLSADILGQVYEQFLGKVIRLTEGHRAVVDDKPEVKKAGGVYYTPTYIVDYIVRQTVGKLLEEAFGSLMLGSATVPVAASGVSPEAPARDAPTAGPEPLAAAAFGPSVRQAVLSPEVPAAALQASRRDAAKCGRVARAPLPPRAATAILNRVAKLRILDPACGSGSFLIGAYQYLLDWHLQFYVGLLDEGDRLTRPPGNSNGGAGRGHWLLRGRNPPIVQTTRGWKLTIAERKRILLNNIFGVDIDTQAVEVTKLSLLLKVLEGETGQSLQTLFRFSQERALPDLGDNIKCGNSLIGPDFYQQAELPLLTDDEKYRINVFDWHAEFPQIFKVGGFDAVIGNPPYIRIQTMKDSQPQEVEYFSQAYQAASQGNYDIYVVFVERGLSLLNHSGKLGFILPHKFFNSEYGQPVRKLLSEGRHLEHIVHFGAEQVFSTATTYTCLLFLSRGETSSCSYVSVPKLKLWVKDRTAVHGDIGADNISDGAWNFAVGHGAKLVNRLKAMPTKLGDLADIFVGLQTSADDVFIMDCLAENSRSLRLKSKSLEKEVSLETDLLHPLVSGTDVHGYPPLPRRQFILFPYEVKDETASLISFNELNAEFPKSASYLAENKVRLQERERGKFKDVQWYRFGRSQNLGIQSRAKICVPRLVDRLCAGFDSDGSHFLATWMLAASR